MMSLEVNDWDQPLVKRRKLPEHTDSSCPRNADPQGERGDGGPGDNEAYGGWKVPKLLFISLSSNLYVMW